MMVLVLTAYNVQTNVPSVILVKFVPNVQLDSFYLVLNVFVIIPQVQIGIIAVVA
jgi:hypothetical protein